MFSKADRAEIRREAKRLGVSFSWLMRRAWAIAREKMARLPTAARLLLLAGLTGGACSGGPPPLLVSPARATVAPAQVLTLAAAATPPVTWTVTEPGGGTVSASGVYSAPPCGPSVPGTYHVVAEAGGRTGSAEIRVQEAVLEVTVSPSSVQLAPGQTQQFTATVRTSCGSATTGLSVTAPP
jgi:uncharacterized small protein (TIGR04563 family)